MPQRSATGNVDEIEESLSQLESDITKTIENNTNKLKEADEEIQKFLHERQQTNKILDDGLSVDKVLDEINTPIYEAIDDDLMIELNTRRTTIKHNDVNNDDDDDDIGGVDITSIPSTTIRQTQTVAIEIPLTPPTTTQFIPLQTTTTIESSDVLLIETTVPTTLMTTTTSTTTTESSPTTFVNSKSIVDDSNKSVITSITTTEQEHISRGDDLSLEITTTNLPIIITTPLKVRINDHRDLLSSLYSSNPLFFFNNEKNKNITILQPRLPILYYQLLPTHHINNYHHNHHLRAVFFIIIIILLLEHL